MDTIPILILNSTANNKRLGWWLYSELGICGVGTYFINDGNDRLGNGKLPRRRTICAFSDVPDAEYLSTKFEVENWQKKKIDI